MPLGLVGASGLSLSVPSRTIADGREIVPGIDGRGGTRIKRSRQFGELLYVLAPTRGRRRRAIISRSRASDRFRCTGADAAEGDDHA